MIKKLIFSSIACASIYANACTVNYVTSEDVVIKVIGKYKWGFSNYDAVCEKLRRANAVILVKGDATVLGNKSIAWATVNLKDGDLMIFTNSYGGNSTTVNGYASIDRAEQLLMQSINDAVDSMDVDSAIRSLNEARKKVRAAYSR